MDDKELLSLLQSDDNKGLKILMQKYEKLAGYVVSRLLSDPSDIEEAVSDTFLRIWQGRGRIDLSRSSLKSYVCMVASGCAVDKLRRTDRAEREDIDDCDIGVDVSYEDEAARSINMKVIAHCVSTMRHPDREVFIERYYHKLAVKEIAQRHGLSPKKVENILYRGKKTLKKALLKGGIIL
ncbi:MAG: sigma-70 family RNA polymerase sigma factor [Ruminococcus sp.]|nr:sigma-70 family RNA polymerase sigma factor [Ruminococcus sp.]